MYLVRTAGSAVNYLFTKTSGVHLNTGWVAINPSGGVAVASTVGGLGAGSAGAQGFLRLGSAPYEYLAVTYDATLGKWVAPTTTHRLLDSSTASGLGGTLGTLIEITTIPVKPLWESWAVKDAAGLKPQIQIQSLFASFGATGSNTGCKFSLGYKKISAGGTLELPAGISVATATYQSATVTTGLWVVDQGFKDIDAGFTAGDLITPVLFGTPLAGNTGSWGATINECIMQLRWVG
jgi:hypothetical protein